jgi:integrase
MWQGKQIAPTLALRPTAANLKAAARLREQILREIDSGIFQFATHFPDYRHREKHQPAPPTEALTFDAWADTWESLAARELEHSTLAIYKRHLKAYWRPVLGGLLPAKITHRMLLERLAYLATERFDEDTGEVATGLSRKTQNNILIPLRAVFELICKPPSTITNPTEGIDNLRVQKGKPDPFAPDEVDTIIRAIRELRGEAWADYFEFSFFAGLRASEHIALQWEDVDLRKQTVLVRRAKVMSKEKDRTKTNVERTVELNARAAAVIQRQRARTQALGAQVFFNPSTARPYADEQQQRLVWGLALRKTGIRYRAPKECRDTSVTMALMAGANPMWVAAQHGHSVTVMLKDYANWIPSADRGMNLAAVNSAIAPAKAAKNAI